MFFDTFKILKTWTSLLYSELKTKSSVEKWHYRTRNVAPVCLHFLTIFNEFLSTWKQFAIIIFTCFCKIFLHLWDLYVCFNLILVILFCCNCIDFWFIHSFVRLFVYLFQFYMLIHVINTFLLIKYVYYHTIASHDLNWVQPKNLNLDLWVGPGLDYSVNHLKRDIAPLFFCSPIKSIVLLGCFSGLLIFVLAYQWTT